MPTLHVATLRDFDAGSYLARVTLKGSLHMSLDDVPVSRAIDAADMDAGNEVTVAIFDETQARDARVIAVYA
jgi:hypothetical protein